MADDASAFHAAVSFNQAALDELLRGSHGPAARLLARLGAKIESQAKFYATGNYHGRGGTGYGPNVDTGRFRGSITWRLGADGEGLFLDVGSAVEYALYLELGTRYMDARPSLAPAMADVISQPANFT